MKEFLYRLKELLKKNSDEIKTLFVIFLLTITFIYGLPILLGTRTPVAYIVSGSMQDTYFVGDVIIVKGRGYTDINVGDTVIYQKPDNEDEIIFHRVAYVYVENGNRYYITKGDFNDQIDPWNPVPERNIIGKVIYRIPYLGYFFILVRNPLVFIELFILLILLAYAPLPKLNIKQKKKMIKLLFLVILVSYTIALINANKASKQLEVEVTSFSLTTQKLRDGRVVDYYVFYLKIISKNFWIKWISRVEIIAYDNHSTVIGVAIWKTVYAYNGVIRASIALIPENSVKPSKIILKAYIQEITGNISVIEKEIV